MHEPTPREVLIGKVALALRQTKYAQAGMSFGVPEEGRDDFLRALATTALDTVRTELDAQIDQTVDRFRHNLGFTAPELYDMRISELRSELKGAIGAMLGDE